MLPIIEPLSHSNVMHESLYIDTTNTMMIMHRDLVAISILFLSSMPTMA
jgi:hypothetical protein